MHNRFHRLALFLYLAFAFLLGMRTISNEDIWWHLKAGQWILGHLEVPRVDSFTFGAEGHPWIDLHWLFQVLVFVAYRLGPSGLMLMQIALFVALAAGLILLKPPGARLGKPLALGTLALLALQFRISLRPELVSWLFLALALNGVERFRRTGSRRFLLALPVLQILWVNLHSLYILGLAVLWVFAVGEAIQLRLIRGGWLEPVVVKGREAPPNLVFVWMTAVVGTVASLATPYGLQAFALPLTLYGKTTGGHDVFSKYIGEFFPPWHPMYMPWLPALLALVALVAFGSLYRARRKVSVYRVLLVLAFLHLALRASRNAPLFAIVSMGVTIAGLGEGAENEDHSTRLAQARSAALCLLLAASIWAMCTNRLFRWTYGDAFGWGFDPKAYIDEASAFVGAADLKGNALVIPLGRASRFIWDHAPERRVMIDSRLEVAGPELFSEYAKVSEALNRGDKDATALLDRMEVRYVIADHRWWEAEEGLLRTRDWELVHFDPVASVYVRKDWPGNEGVIASHKIDWSLRLFGPSTPPPSWLLEPLARPSSRLLSWFRGTPDESRATLAAQAYIKFHTYFAANGSPADPLAYLAAREARKERSRMPSSPHALFHLASAYRRLGAPEPSTQGLPAWPPVLTIRYSQALAIARLGLRENASDMRGLFAAYLCSSKLGLRDLSLEYLEALASLHPGLLESEERVIDSARKMLPGLRGEIARAHRELEQRPVPQGGDEDALAAARIRLELGLSADAVAVLKKQEGKVRPRVSLEETRARLAILRGEPEVATAIWQASAELFSNEELQERLATSDFVQGSLGAALDRLQRGEDPASRRFWTHWLLAAIQTELGNRDEATREVEAARSSVGDGPTREELERSLGWVARRDASPSTTP